MHLSSLSASAVAAALIAAASVLAFSEAPALFVWAAFIGWASYDHSGGTAQAAIRSSAALVFGVIMAWLVALVVAARLLPLNLSTVMPIVAGIASFLIVWASRVAWLSVVPATFYGFASTFAYLSLSAGPSTITTLTSFGWNDAIFSLPLSLLIGTGLGIIHQRLAKALAVHDTGSASLGLSVGARASKQAR